ncbi:MAG: trigger factor [Coriobacteriales bacterium]
MEITSRVFEEDGEKRELILTLTATAEEVDENIKQFFKDAREQKEIPGFRKGKAPRNVIEQNLGGHEPTFGAIAETIINTLSFKVIDDADVIFVAEPEFNVDTLPEDHKPFRFTVSGPVLPKVELSSLEPVAIEMPPDEATEAEIEAHLDNLRDYYHTYQAIDDPEHQAEMGDYVDLTMTCTKSDTSEIRGLTNVDRLIGLGAGTMPASFDEHIVGAKRGDKLAFDFEVEDGSNPQFGDGKLKAEVEIRGFRACIIPELDDAFAQKLGSKDVEELRGAVKMALDNDKRKELPNLMVERCMEQLVGRIKGEVPEYFVEIIKEDVFREFMQSMEKNGTSLQEWMLKNDMEKEEIQDQILQEARHRAALDVAIEALFEGLGLELTDEELDITLAKEENPEEIRRSWEQANRMAELRKIARQDMVTRWLVKNAQVTVVE